MPAASDALRPERPMPDGSVREMLAGFGGALVGRVATNPPTRWAIEYQNGTFDRDAIRRGLTAKALRGRLIGTGAQGALTYGLRRAQTPSFQQVLGERQGQLASDFLAGAVGSLALHPSAVLFFQPDQAGHAQPRSRFPTFAQMRGLLATNPQVFARGLPARFLLGGADWGVYFGIKQMLAPKEGDEATRSGTAAEVIAATVATFLTMPVYQAYVRQLQTGESFRQAGKMLLASGGAAGWATLALTGATVAGRVVTDKAQRALGAKPPADPAEPLVVPEEP